MIVRIMGEGQYRVTESQVAELNQLDAALEADLNENDGAEFRIHLARLVSLVRAGARLADDEFEPSDFVLPPEDASIEEVREMMGAEGLVPG